MKKLLLLFAIALAGCTSANTGEPSIAKAVWERLKDSQEDATGEKSGKATPTRKQITDFNVAMIQMNLDGEDIYPIMLPTHRNGPYIVYGNKFRQSLTLIESQITATRGLGTDLISATSSPNDPLKVLTSPNRWPEVVEREYRFGGGGVTGRIERYTCSLSKAGPAQIQLAGTKFAVIGFAETCKGNAGVIQNLYAADANTGRVWQSKQYVGPTMPAVNLDILEPLTE